MKDAKTEIDELKDRIMEALDELWWAGYQCRKALLVPGNGRLDEREFRNKATKKARDKVTQVIYQWNEHQKLLSRRDEADELSRYFNRKLWVAVPGGTYRPAEDYVGRSTGVSSVPKDFCAAVIVSEKLDERLAQLNLTEEEK